MTSSLNVTLAGIDPKLEKEPQRSLGEQVTVLATLSIVQPHRMLSFCCWGWDGGGGLTVYLSPGGNSGENNCVQLEVPRTGEVHFTGPVFSLVSFWSGLCSLSCPVFLGREFS